jgi:hypothetical protein
MERPKCILLSPASPIDGQSQTARKLHIARDIVAKLRAAGVSCELIIPDDEIDDEPIYQ